MQIYVKLILLPDQNNFRIQLISCVYINFSLHATKINSIVSCTFRNKNRMAMFTSVI